MQIDALSPRPRSLLRRTAVLGDSFPLSSSPAWSSPRPDVPAHRRRRALDVPRAAGRPPLAVRHAVHRETAYAGLPMKVRSRLHAQVGDVLARSPGAMQRRPEALAHHFYAAGRYEQAWRCARLAGVTRPLPPLRRRPPRPAMAAEAAQQSGTVPLTERATDLESWGDALFLCGRSGAADHAYARARRLRAGEPLGAASLALKAAKVAQRQGRHPVALRRTAVGLRLLEGYGGAAGRRCASAAARSPRCRADEPGPVPPTRRAVPRRRRASPSSRARTTRWPRPTSSCTGSRSSPGPAPTWTTVARPCACTPDWETSAARHTPTTTSRCATCSRGGGRRRSRASSVQLPTSTRWATWRTRPTRHTTARTC